MPEHEQPDAKVELPETGEAGSGGKSSATLIVSIAAVTVTALVGLFGVFNAWNSQYYEEEKNERDFRLSCVTSAATIATMAFSLSKDFKSMSDDEKIDQINIIIASFPPDTANRFLSALAPHMGTAQSVIQAFQVAQENSSAQVAAEQRLTCPTAPQLIPSGAGNNLVATPAATAPPLAPIPSAPIPSAPTTSAPTTSAAPPAAAPAPAPPQAGAVFAPTPAPALTPAPVGRRSYTVYYQITEPGDASYAALLAKDVAASSADPSTTTNFTTAGVELVAAAAALKQTEVRYYRADQLSAAQDLLDQLKLAAQAKSLRLDYKIVYIGARYPNLPPGRMEVWFQPLTKAHQS